MIEGAVGAASTVSVAKSLLVMPEKLLTVTLYRAPLFAITVGGLKVGPIAPGMITPSFAH